MDSRLHTELHQLIKLYQVGGHLISAVFLQFVIDNHLFYFL